MSIKGQCATMLQDALLYKHDKGLASLLTRLTSRQGPCFTQPHFVVSTNITQQLSASPKVPDAILIAVYSDIATS